MSICVIGAGINGLSTACTIQQMEPRARVCVVADKFSPETTSDIAAGFWRPVYLNDPRTELIKEWGSITFNHIEQLYQNDPLLYGVTRTSGYELFDEVQDIPYWHDIVHDFTTVKLEQLPCCIEGMGIKYAHHFTTYLLESTSYLPVLQQRFIAHGGTVRKQKLSSLDSLIDFDVIVNCCGLGSTKLVNDRQAYPIRGQVFVVNNPAIKQFYNVSTKNFGGYILPNITKTVVGGTHQDGNSNLQVDPNDSHMIWSNMTKLVPPLQKSTILRQQVGLRPGRDQIRLELEVRQLGDKKVNVVHNYGHGGSGITLFQGCAQHATTLALNALHRPNAKL